MQIKTIKINQHAAEALEEIRLLRGNSQTRRSIFSGAIEKFDKNKLKKKYWLVMESSNAHPSRTLGLTKDIRERLQHIADEMGMTINAVSQYVIQQELEREVGI